jgi:trk system potassium uptake protein TrkA
MKKGKKLTVVIGSSRLGAAIASQNSKQGIYTSIIDINEEAFRKLDEGYSGFKIVGDAIEIRTLEKAHIKDASEVDVCTGDDNTNIFIASLILKYYDVPYIIVRLHDDIKRSLLENPRITIISPSSLSLGLYENLWDGD